MTSTNPIIFGTRATNNMYLIHESDYGGARINSPTVFFLALITNAITLGLTWMTGAIMSRSLWASQGIAAMLVGCSILLALIVLKAYYITTKAGARKAVQSLLFLSSIVVMAILLGSAAVLLDRFMDGFGSRLVTTVVLSQVFFSAYNLIDRALDNSGHDLSCSLPWIIIGTVGVAAAAFLITAIGCLPASLCEPCSTSLFVSVSHAGWVAVSALALLTLNAVLFARVAYNEVVNITGLAYSNRGVNIGVVPYLALGLHLNIAWHFIEILRLPASLRNT